MAYGTKLTRWIYEHSPILLQDFATTCYGWREKQKRYGHYFRKYFNLLQECQWYEEQKLRDVQNEKLRKLVEYSYENVPYYRSLFDKEGLKPCQIETVDDLPKIPTLDKDTVRKRWKELLSRNYPLNKAVIYRTSGTTGKPLKMYVSRNCFEREYAYRWMHYSWGGMQLGERFATVAGHPVVPIDQKKPPYWRYNKAENQLIFSSQHMSQDALPYYADALRRFQPSIIYGYPSSIYLIARYLAQKGLSDVFPKAVFTVSETLMDFQRMVIEKVFGCKVFNWYGMTEMVAHATECEQGAMHIQPMYGIMEIVSEMGDKVQEGIEGHIIGTGFDNWVMPLIRYNSGDVAVPISKKCSCGRGYPLIENVLGRTDDYVITPEGRYVGRLGHIFQQELHVVESQLIQEELNILRVQVVKDKGYSDEDTRKIIQGLQERLGNVMRYELEYVDHIPRGRNGKFRFVISKVAKL